MGKEISNPRLGQLIRQLRKQHGLRQADLARELGIGQSQVSAYENGKFKTITPEFITRLSQIFKVAPGELLTVADLAPTYTLDDELAFILSQATLSQQEEVAAYARWRLTRDEQADAAAEMPPLPELSPAELAEILQIAGCADALPQVSVAMRIMRAIYRLHRFIALQAPRPVIDQEIAVLQQLLTGE